MTAGETTTLTLAGLAIVAGWVVALGMWQRSRRRRRAVRSRHPSARPPLSVDLARGAGAVALVVEVRRGAPTLSIDILAFRDPGSDREWDSLPIVDPIHVEPGVPMSFPLPLATGAESVDVVVGWTAHHGTGDLPASRLFRLPSGRELAGLGPRAGALGGWTAVVLLALLGVAGALVVRSVVASDDGSDDASDGISDDASEEPIPRVPISSSSPVGPSPTSAPGEPDPAPSTAAPTPPDRTTATSAPPTTAPAATASSPTTSSTRASSPTSPPTGGRQVIAAARAEPCRFGDDCLVVGFRLDGFPNPPGEYVCEFDDGSRFTFVFDSQGVETACATGRAGAAITVVVDGVRSATVTRADAPVP